MRGPVLSAPQKESLSAGFALARHFGPNSEFDADVEFLSVKGESPSFFLEICQSEHPPVDDKGMVVYPGPLNGVDHADPGGTSKKWIVSTLAG
jgi:hypothetical protein